MSPRPNLAELNRARATHGASRTKIYNIWLKMISRCTKALDPAYDRYGGRGIRVCDRWMSFENFFADMGDCPAGKSLDRIDVNGDYRKENCRWASHKEQNQNRRDNRMITFNGETLVLQEWARRLGITHSTLQERLSKWTLERALTEPAHNTRKQKD